MGKLGIDYHEAGHNFKAFISVDWNSYNYPQRLPMASSIDQLIEKYFMCFPRVTNQQIYIEEEATLKASLPEKLNPYFNQIEAFKAGVSEKKLTPISAYAFCSGDILTFWVVIQELDVEIEMQYGDIFLDLYDQYPDKKFDLMTFGKNEIEFVEIPSEAQRLF
jgi:hypothetical protein